jgi:hypothetical protein
MIGDVFEVIFEIILEFIPSIVWKLLFVVIGIVTAVVGTTMITESPQTGGALSIMGAILLGGSLVSLYR